MKNKVTIIYRIFKADFSIIYFFISAVLIVALSYFLGHQLLEGIMMGSDSSFAITTLTYLDKWFPNIPLWYPYQGAGQSITLGYYVLTYYIPILIHHLTSLTLVQGMRLTEFLIVPVIAMEIYLYCWFRLRNQTMGLIAALMYPLSSATWAWMTHGGFYAMSISLVFLLPAFAFYDWYLDLILTENKSKIKKRGALIFSVLFLAIAISSHLAVGASVLTGMGFYTLFRSQAFPLKVPRKRSTIIAIGILALVVVVGILVSAALFFPQRHYNSEITQDIVPVYGPDIPQLSLPAFLGFKRYDPMFDSIYQPMFLNAIVSIFMIVGLLFGLIRRNFMGAFGISVFALAFIVSITKVLNGFSYYFAVIMLPTNVRLASYVFILGPILAAYGIWCLSDLPFSLFRHLLKIKTLLIRDPMYIVAAILSILIFIGTIYNLRFYQRWPAGPYNEFPYIGIGPMGVIPSFCIIPELNYQPPTGVSCKNTLPAFTDSNIGRDPLPELKYDQFINKLGFNRFTRTDVSVHLGLLTATANMHSNASMINSYNGIGSLIYVWWGHEVRVMFLNGNYTADNVSEMAKYFGIKYIFLHAGDDKPVLYRYPASLWNDVGILGGAILVKEFKNAPPLASQITRNTILVIGSQGKSAYEQVFKLAYSGGLSIDKGLIVKGREKIDDYNLSELSKFNAIILSGYSYNNRDNTYSLLRQYVANGGSVLIDNGWQYVAKDWGLDKSTDNPPVYSTSFADPMPITKTTWGDMGKSFTGFTVSPSFTNVNISKFGPLTWGDQAWGLTSAGKEDLAPQAAPLLYEGDRVVVAERNYGKGRIVWSGINLISFVGNSNYPEEYKFVKDIFNYLLPQNSNEIPNAISLSSNYPDVVNMTFNNDVSGPSWVYFREAYTQDWHPKLVLPNGKTENVTLYKAGPGLTLIYLPPVSAGSVLTLSYNLGILIPVSIAITIITLLILVLYLLDGVFNTNVTEKMFNSIIGRRFAKNNIKIPAKSFSFSSKNQNQEEEDY